MGQREDPLVQADQMIKDKNFDGAILFLRSFIQENPDRFDEAQKRLHQVIAIREAYYLKGEELLAQIKSGPEDKDKILQLTQELNNIAPASTDETKGFIAAVKKKAAFEVYRRQLYNIMAQGKILIDQAKYAEAAKTYIGGLVYYREEFDQGPYDKLTRGAVMGLIDQIKAEEANYEASQAELGRMDVALRAALASADPEAVAQAWTEIEGLLKNRALRRNGVITSAQNLGRQLEAMKKQDPSLEADGDASFIPFARQVSLGRTQLSTEASTLFSTFQLEGLVGTMDSQWIALVNGFQKEYEAAQEKEYARGLAAYSSPSPDWEGAAAAFDNAAGLAEVGLEFFDLWSLLDPQVTYPGLAQVWQLVLQDKPTSKAKDGHLARIAASEARLARLLAVAGTTAAIAADYRAKLGPSSALAESLKTLGSSRAALTELIARIGAEAKVEADLAKDLQAYLAQGLSLDSTQAAQADLAAKIKAASDSVLANEIAVLSSALGFESERLTAELASQTADLAASRLLLEGQTPAAPGGSAPALITDKVPMYPGQSARNLTALGTRLADLRARLATYTKKIAGETTRVSTSPVITEALAVARALEAEAAALDTQRSSILAKAQDQKRRADAASNEGRLRYDEAERARRAQNFDLARERRDLANTRYSESFALEFNQALQDSWETNFRTLGEAIARDEQNKAFTDIAALLGNGRTAFYQDNFVRAQTLYTQANAISLKVFKKEDLEAAKWLSLVERAQSGNQGRTIEPNSPLYAEMSGLISLARTFYNQGLSFKAQKKDTEAKAAFTQARDKIQQVKLVFPVNRDASVLGLRIDQEMDPAGFRASFALKYEAARKDAAAPTKETRANLEDLYSVDPNYRGLKTTLDQVKEALSPRNLVVIDPKRKADATALLASARAILDSGDTARFQIGLDMVSRAIDLDPTNTQVGSIKNRYLTFLSSAQTQLSAAAEAQYLQAVTEFTAGNNVLANALVDRLLADPRNRDSQKLNDLSKKIKARL